MNTPITLSLCDKLGKPDKGQRISEIHIELDGKLRTVRPAIGEELYYYDEYYGEYSIPWAICCDNSGKESARINLKYAHRIVWG